MFQGADRPAASHLPCIRMGHCYGKFLSMSYHFGRPHGHYLPLSPYHPKRRHRLSDRGLCIILAFFLWDVCILPLGFSSPPYGKPAHSRCRDLRHTAAQHPLARALNFIPAAAAGSITFPYPGWTLVCFIIYRLTGHIPLLGLEAAGAAVLIGPFS